MSHTEFRILLVDDEPDILEFLGYNLRKEGFRVFTAANGKEAVKVAAEAKPHLVLLDVMMPDMDGIETCRQIRETVGMKNVVVAFLTARNEDYSQIAGFEAGADDYISKPVKPRVLISRIKALLRRFEQAGSESDRHKIRAGDIEILLDRYLVKKNEEEFVLPRKEFELLALLASSPGKVFTRESILSRIWGDDVIVTDRTIDVHVRKLREKLGEDYIKTVKGVGYKFDF